MVGPDLWYSSIRTDIPAAPVPMIDKATIKAAKAFTKETFLWKLDINPMNVVEDTRTYELVIPGTYDVDIVEIYKAWYKQDGDENSQFGELDPFVEGDKSDAWEYDEADVPSEFWFSFGVDGESYINLYPIPTADSTGGLKAKVSVSVSLDATEFPNWIHTNHYETIEAGIKAELYAKGGMPWADAQAALYWRNRFKAECGDSRFQEKIGHTRRQLSVKMREFI